MEEQKTGLLKHVGKYSNQRRNLIKNTFRAPTVFQFRINSHVLIAAGAIPL